MDKPKKLPVRRHNTSETEKTKPINPVLISEETVKLFSKHSITIGKLLRKGKYGAVYEGKVGLDFNSEQFVKKFKCDFIHMKSIPQKGRKIAIKFVDIPARKQLGVEDVEEAMQKEVTALTAIQCQGVVDMYYAINLHKQWFLLLESADGNLQSLIKMRKRAKQTISYERAIHWIKKLVQSVLYLHSIGITHGSIKSSNVLFFILDKNEDKIDVKISDFVLSFTTNVDQISTDDKQLMDDRMTEDVMDLYFLLTEILTITEFKSQSTAQSLQQNISQLVSTEGNSTQVMKALLSSKQLSD